jgi:hypothetical protein
VSKEDVAWKKFQKAEAQCKLTNDCFTALEEGKFCFPSDVNAVFHGAQRIISRVLGRVPSFDELKLAFGPGANTSAKARASSPRWKLGARLECSADLVQSLPRLLEEVPRWVEHHAHWETLDAYYVNVVIVNGRLQFVPKNAKTFRSIVVEPPINAIFQRGAGIWIADRLALAGVPLNSQDRNQKLARSGSISGTVATVDESMASDTKAKALVANLLPSGWYTFLAQFRTGKVDYRGETIVLEKFSSMGNGFTFELETLIFYALTRAVCEHLGLPTGWIAVYGDDIIIPTEGYPLLEKVLNAAGFTVNQEKSYASGPFRESCGKDYWRGIDIRPYYQKTMVSGRTLFTLHNHYMREFDFKRARKVVNRIHPSLRLYGPDGYGDGHLIGDWSSSRVSRASRDRGWEGVRFDTFSLVPKRNMRMAPGDDVLPCYSIYVAGDKPLSFTDISDPSDHFVVRGSKGYKRMSIYTLRRNIYT